MTRPAQLGSIYFATIFFSLHYGLPLYLESSYLNSFLPQSFLGIIYGVGAALSLLLTLNIGKYLNRFSNYKLTSLLLVIEICLLLTLSFSNNFWILIATFIAHQVAVATMYILFNVFVEELSKKEQLGRIHGVYLTLLNTGVVVSPFIASYLYTEFGFPGIWFSAALLAIPALLSIFLGLHDLEEPHYKAVDVRDAVYTIKNNTNLRNIWLIQLLLEIFYAVMIIYTPVYLQNFGISLSSYLGVIMPIILLPFIFFPYTLGKIADMKTGEKEFLYLGFLLTALSLGTLTYTHSTNIFIWTAILGVGRIGASIIEAMASSYFLKKIDPDDSNLVAVFTNTRPIALIIAPITSAILVSLISTQYIFLILGGVLLCGVLLTYPLEDTL